MAVEKGKVLAELELKTKGKSLSKIAKDKIAAKWADKINSDEEIASYVDDQADLLDEMAAEADRRATEATKKALEKTGAPKPEKTESSEDGKDDDDTTMPEWAKAMKKQNATRCCRKAKNGTKFTRSIQAAREN